VNKLFKKFVHQLKPKLLQLLIMMM